MTMSFDGDTPRLPGGEPILGKITVGLDATAGDLGLQLFQPGLFLHERNVESLGL